MAKNREYFRGCLLGLAVGDAMGHTVDARTLQDIYRDYGPNGLLGYDLVNGYADVTSYTQVAAFAANGLLMGLTRRQLNLRMAPPVRYISAAVREWSRSQYYCPPERNYCWLSTLPEMKRRHCLDNRMLDILAKGLAGTMDAPVSRFNHPGALTQVIPIVLLGDDLEMTEEELDDLAAQTVALTHGDPEAFLSGAALCRALRLLLKQPHLHREEVLEQTRNAIQLEFGRKYAQTGKLWELLQLAVSLSHSDNVSPIEAMEQLGCRTSAEVLAGVLYAVATCHGDFDAAMITAVNHSGRSAAVGALTGAVLGLTLGESSLPDFYLESLEPAPYLAELADDLFQGCPMGAGSNLYDDDWDRKYLHGGK